MNRREFLKTTAACAAANCLASGKQVLAAAPDAATQPSELVGVCGLYCGICKSKADGECHGCGCSCGKCAGAAHKKSCAIAKCAAARKVESCADCKDLPCTRVIQFANDPLWRTHAPVVENLRRRKAIGTAAWLKEQADFWQNDKDAAAAWLALNAECDKRYAESRKNK